MTEKHVVIPHRLYKAIQDQLPDYKILFVSAGVGWGKTTGTRASLNHNRAVYISVQRNRIPRLPAKEPLVVLDDFQNLSPHFDKRMSEILLRSSKRQRIIILSRGMLPDYLLPYQYSGSLLLMTAEDLALNSAEVMQLVHDFGVILTGSDLRQILHETYGYPPLIKYVLHNIQAIGLCSEALKHSRMELYCDWDITLFGTLNKELCMALLCTSYFKTVTTPLMVHILSKPNADDILRQICHRTGILKPELGNAWRYDIPNLVIPYLKQKVKQIMVPQHVERLHILGGDWCREQKDYVNALVHYQSAGHFELVQQTIVDAVQQDNRAFVLCECADSLFSMAENDLCSTPELVYAMSRVSSLFFDYQQTKYWYHILENMACKLVVNADLYLSHLKLCLPQTISNQKIEPAQTNLPQHTTLPIGAYSLTATLPSILRGEQDLTCLVQQPMTATGQSMLERIQTIFGENTGRILELLQAEYHQEQGEDINAILHQWHPLQLQFRALGAVDLEFVCVVLTARTLCMEGQIPEAASYLLRFRHRAEVSGAHELLPNIDAARCRIALMEDSIYWVRWLETQPPTGGVVRLLDGYRLLTKVRCHIKREEYATAMLFLGHLLDGYERSGRTLDYMESLILAAICLYRQGKKEWSTFLEQAFLLGESKKFISVFAREGAAILPLLEEHGRNTCISPQYKNKILRKTMVQSAHCASYLRPEHHLSKPLTSTEYTILLLLMRHRSIEQMAQTLGIKVSTVRTHLRNLFSKLGVHTQEDARNAAIRLKLV